MDGTATEPDRCRWASRRTRVACYWLVTTAQGHRRAHSCRCGYADNDSECRTGEPSPSPTRGPRGTSSSTAATGCHSRCRIDLCDRSASDLPLEGGADLNGELTRRGIGRKTCCCSYALAVCQYRHRASPVGESSPRTTERKRERDDRPHDRPVVLVSNLYDGVSSGALLHVVDRALALQNGDLQLRPLGPLLLLGGCRGRQERRERQGNLE